MALKKQCNKNKTACEVTFQLSKKEAQGAATASVAGDFNGWDINATCMKKTKRGDFVATVSLEPGRAYQFRYVLDGANWINDLGADKYLPSNYGSAENSVVEV